MSEWVHKTAFRPWLIVYLVIGAIWAAFAVLTVIYGDPNEPLQNIGRLGMMAGIGIMAGAVIARRLLGVKETAPQDAERPRNS